LFLKQTKSPEKVLKSKMSIKKYLKITPKKGTFGAKIDLDLRSFKKT
jgi:hypothetical protein